MDADTIFLARILAVHARALADDLDALVAPPPPPPPPMPVWPNNEPPNLTPLIHADGSSKLFIPKGYSGARWLDDTKVCVVDDPASRYGKVIQKRFVVGDQNGWLGIHACQGAPGFGNAAGYKELYFRCVAMFAPNWQWEIANTQKLFYFGMNSKVGSPSQYFLSVARDRVDFVVQTGDPNVDCDYRYLPGGDIIKAGEYFTIELLIGANSWGASNGSAFVWLNGINISDGFVPLPLTGALIKGKGLSGRVWSMEQIPSFNGLEAFLYYGGQGDVIKADTFVNLSELYVSGMP